MSKQKAMDLNRETAMRLWNKTFGKETKVRDFAGRMMAKGAYNDRSSDFGWNVDHILPQSRGGVTADHNLVCCHILTNDEKADRFPCFKANGIQFEIRRVQNHYEIQAKKASVKVEQEDDDIDFYDSAAGVRFFKKLKGIQKERFVGTVFIHLTSVSNSAVVDFVDRIFDSENIFLYSLSKPAIAFSLDGSVSKIRETTYPSNVKIMISNLNMLVQSDIAELLDKCILLNTYLSSYFLKCEYVKGFDIRYRVDRVERATVPVNSDLLALDQTHFAQYLNGLYVNDLVLINTDAGKKVKKDMYSSSEYTLYDFVFTNLQKNLVKEVGGK